MDDGDPTCTQEPPNQAARPARGAGAREPARLELIAAAAGLDDQAERWLRDHAARALAALDAPGEVRVRIVGDAEMNRVHQQFMGTPGTTDVLTFDLTEGAAAAGRSGLDVDILICLDEAQRQAAGRALTVERELLLYLLHGVLHCLGYDDHTEPDAAAMHAREDQVLQAIGVGATYLPGRSDPGTAPGEGSAPV
jgi:probable rRNA maturation factor